MATVTIKGWRVGLRKVSMTQALRANCGFDLADAKAVTDRVLASEFVEVHALNAQAARQLVAELNEFGADAVMADQ